MVNNMHTLKLNYDYPKKPDQHMVVSIPKKQRIFDDKYPYYKDGFWYKLGRKFVYAGSYTIAYVICYLILGIRFKGRKNLKRYKNELSDGCITICNHVFRYDYICIMIGIRPHKQYYPAWNAKLLDKDRNLVSLSGGIPLPDSMLGFRKFFEALDRHIKEKSWLHFFPEAAMWPFYQTIRPFKDGAFILAERNKVPILPMAFEFRNPGKFARLFGFTEPRATLNIGDPIYVDYGVPERQQRIAILKEKSYMAVKKLSGSKDDDEKIIDSTKITNKELLVNTLMIEYKNIHDRVFYSIKKFEDSNIKLLAVMGTLLFFCFKEFQSQVIGIGLAIDIAFFIAMPVLCFTALAMANSHMNEVIFFGNYLKIIENKVNLIVSDDIKELHFPNDSLIDWEFWRRFYGYQRKGKVMVNITFGVFSTSLVIALYLLSILIRLVYYYSSNVENFWIWIIVSSAILLLLLVYIIISAYKIMRRRREQETCYKEKVVDYEIINA